MTTRARRWLAPCVFLLLGGCGDEEGGAGGVDAQGADASAGVDANLPGSDASRDVAAAGGPTDAASPDAPEVGGTGGGASGGAPGSGGAATGGSPAGGSGGSSTGGSGGAATGGCGGDASGGSGGLATGGAGGVTPAVCTHAPDKVCADYPGAQIYFHDASAQLLYQSPGPAEYALPAGGSVTVRTYPNIPVTYVAVPAGTVLAPPTYVVPPPPQKLQSIEVTVPPFPDTTQPIWVNWGCGGVTVQPNTPKLLDVTESCVEQGKAELYAWAADDKHGGNVYSYVRDVAVGAQDQPPVKITMPAWQTSATKVALTIEGIPAGLTGTAGFYAFRGAMWIYNGTRTVIREASGNANLTFFNMVPAIGTGWWRRTTLYPMDAGLDGTSTEAWLPVGYPLSTAQMFPYASLLPIPDVSASGATASWTKIGDPDVDRVILTVTTPGTNVPMWRVYLPPAAATFTFPTAPQELGDATKGGLGKVTVTVEDRGDIHGYGEALARWPAEITPVIETNAWFWRRSFRVRP